MERHSSRQISARSQLCILEGGRSRRSLPIHPSCGCPEQYNCNVFVFFVVFSIGHQKQFRQLNIVQDRSPFCGCPAARRSNDFINSSDTKVPNSPFILLSFPSRAVRKMFNKLSVSHLMISPYAAPRFAVVVNLSAIG